MKPKYSMTIKWSDEDDAYLVWLPEFGGGPQTHGTTYAEAAAMGQDLIESHIQWLEEDRKPLPEADVYVDQDAEIPLPQRKKATA